MAQCGRGLHYKPDKLSLMPETQGGRREPTSKSCPLTSICESACTYVCTHKQIIYKINYFFKKRIAYTKRLAVFSFSLKGSWVKWSLEFPFLSAAVTQKQLQTIGREMSLAAARTLAWQTEQVRKIWHPCCRLLAHGGGCSTVPSGSSRRENTVWSWLIMDWVIYNANYCSKGRSIEEERS